MAVSPSLSTFLLTCFVSAGKINIHHHHTIHYPYVLTGLSLPRSGSLGGKFEKTLIVMCQSCLATQALKKNERQLAPRRRLRGRMQTADTVSGHASHISHICAAPEQRASTRHNKKFANGVLRRRNVCCIENSVFQVLDSVFTIIINFSASPAQSHVFTETLGSLGMSSVRKGYPCARTLSLLSLPRSAPARAAL